MCNICLFVSHLHHKGKAPKTISTYLSAISYVHKILEYPDPTSSFIISKLTAGAYRSRPSFDFRLPITIQILDQLTDAINFTASCIYDMKLYKAMFLFAFYTFARIGELTTSDRSDTSVIHFKDIEFHTTVYGDSVTVIFRRFKHNLSGIPHKITFNAGESKLSAVTALSDFLKVRSKQPGPLFCSVAGSAISRKIFDIQLHKTLSFCHLDSTRYKGHSFRIGAASYRSEQGDSDAKIRSLGRWKSNAFLKYIRTHNC